MINTIARRHMCTEYEVCMSPNAKVINLKYYFRIRGKPQVGHRVRHRHAKGTPGFVLNQFLVMVIQPIITLAKEIRRLQPSSLLLHGSYYFETFNTKCLLS